MTLLKSCCTDFQIAFNTMSKFFLYLGTRQPQIKLCERTNRKIQFIWTNIEWTESFKSFIWLGFVTWQSLSISTLLNEYGSHALSLSHKHTYISNADCRFFHINKNISNNRYQSLALCHLLISLIYSCRVLFGKNKHQLIFVENIEWYSSVLRWICCWCRQYSNVRYWMQSHNEILRHEV